MLKFPIFSTAWLEWWKKRKKERPINEECEEARREREEAERRALDNINRVEAILDKLDEELKKRNANGR